jgi:hypothetical protein
MEEVRCQRHIPLASDSLGHAANVRVDPEDFHEHQHSWTRSPVRRPSQIAAHGPTIDVDVDTFGLDLHQ